MFKQALDKFFPVPGDLHVSFHLLDSISHLFYGGFLQTFQTALDWKRIHGADVATSFQQCCNLLYIILSQCE